MMTLNKIKAFLAHAFSPTEKVSDVEEKKEKSLDQLYKEREEKILLEAKNIKDGFYDQYDKSLKNGESQFTFSWTTKDMKYWSEKIFKRLYKKFKSEGMNISIEKKIEYVNGTTKDNEVLTMLFHVELPTKQLKRKI